VGKTVQAFLWPALLGFTQNTIREADTRIDEMNQKLQASGLIRNESPDSIDARKAVKPVTNPRETGTASTPTTNPSDRDRGGVITDVVIETERADLRKKREAVLKAIRPGQLATDLSMQK